MGKQLSDLNTNIPTAQFMMPHLGQEIIGKYPARFKVVVCGRRWGKTELAKTLLMEEACQHGMKTWWLAPTYQMAGQVWRDLKKTTTNIAGRDISETDKRIDFTLTGGSIAIRSTHYPDNLRGEGLDYVVLDEAAFMHPDVWAHVVRPMLMTTQGGALFISTPFGKNWFYHCYQMGLDPYNDQWQSFHYTSMDNDLIPASEFEEIQRTTSERIWREEYLAEFRDDAGQVFRGVRDTAIAPTDTKYNPTHRYIMGVDWARDHDYTVLIVLDATTQQMVAIDRFNKVGWETQRNRLEALANTWQTEVIWAEANNIGAPIIEQLQQDGLPVKPFLTTGRSKSPLIESLALAIERREIALLPDEVLLNELVSYAIERLPSGGYRYNAPAGLHDDCVMALAIAWHGVQHGGVRLDFA